LFQISSTWVCVKLPNYEHHPDVREVDAWVVPEELSGHLTRAGSPATSTILSQSEADAIEAQASRSREAVAKMFEQYRPRQVNNSNAVCDTDFTSRQGRKTLGLRRPETRLPSEGGVLGPL
jgi:hypothetical protein